MKTINDSERRDFLKKMLTLTVVTAACPHLLLGKIEPQLPDKIQSTTIKYAVKISDYPALANMWGSIYIQPPLVAPDGQFIFVMLTRVDKAKWGKEFTAVNEVCPHQSNNVNTLNSILHIFICPHQGSKFDPTGHYLWGPANGIDLTSYETQYTDGDDTVYILITFPYDITGVEDNPTAMFYLGHNAPNPCADRTSVVYELMAPSPVEITLWNMRGQRVMTLVNGWVDSGSYSLDIDVSSLAVGEYVLRMDCRGQYQQVRKILVQR